MLTQEMFVHHVYFWLANPGIRDERAKLLEGIKTLTDITYIKSFHIGVPADTHREVIDTSYAFSWLAVFDNKEDQDAYQVDPIHLNFVKNYSYLWDKVIVYDTVSAY
ncbi:MAG: Dabb family protein [Ilyomonas sp.]